MLYICPATNFIDMGKTQIFNKKLPGVRLKVPSIHMPSMRFVAATGAFYFYATNKCENPAEPRTW
jgi:hypothetical protein